jgi:hypothetical protein
MLTTNNSYTLLGYDCCPIDSSAQPMLSRLGSYANKSPTVPDSDSQGLCLNRHTFVDTQLLVPFRTCHTSPIITPACTNIK